MRISILLLLAAALPGQSRSVLIEDLSWTEVRDAIASGMTTAIYTGDPIRKTGHMKFSGSINVSAEAFGMIARDVTLSAISAGFKNVVSMSDHGGAGQEALKRVAAELDPEWGPKGAQVLYIPDLYVKEKEQMMALDNHADIDDTSEVMFIDQEHRWIRKDKLAADTGKMGVNGDPTQATPELGEMFINFKIQDAVAQIKQLIASQTK